jgi:hypothetical protein
MRLTCVLCYDSCHELSSHTPFLSPVYDLEVLALLGKLDDADEAGRYKPSGNMDQALFLCKQKKYHCALKELVHALQRRPADTRPLLLLLWLIQDQCVWGPVSPRNVSLLHNGTGNRSVGEQGSGMLTYEGVRKNVQRMFMPPLLFVSC